MEENVRSCSGRYVFSLSVGPCCSSNNSKNLLVFEKKYMTTNGYPRKLLIDQASGFFPNKIKIFCERENVECLKPGVCDCRAKGMVKRTIGCLKNYVMTYLRESTVQKFKPLILRALSALKLFLHGKTNLTPFEANHGREANTVLQNWTKRPSLNNLDWTA